MKYIYNTHGSSLGRSISKQLASVGTEMVPAVQTGDGARPRRSKQPRKAQYIG
jgi:hypothetical protein